MRARKNEGSINDKRLLTTSEGATYTGIGQTSFRRWCEQIGAVRKFGSRVLFDKNVIDQELDRKEME